MDNPLFTNRQIVLFSIGAGLLVGGVNAMIVFSTIVECGIAVFLSAPLMLIIGSVILLLVARNAK